MLGDSERYQERNDKEDGGRPFYKDNARNRRLNGITHLFRTNSFTRLFPARETEKQAERGGTTGNWGGVAEATLNSVNRKVQSEIKKTAAAKNCR